MKFGTKTFTIAALGLSLFTFYRYRERFTIDAMVRSFSIPIQDIEKK
ncbi:hypothetical protein [Pseudalkalibacillus salsuginis]|nr:hypothetical protein [Pseudalkalibacillus salsuginis]MCF6409454.1 hypothetical protein [Pseudalkalibacillus salsuginis]